MAGSLCKSEGCDEHIHTSAAVSERCNYWVRVFVFQFFSLHGSLDCFSSRCDHSTRFAPNASVASQVDDPAEPQVDGGKGCRDQEDASRECDHLGEREGGDSRCEVLQDSTRREKKRGGSDL